jgi:hypothetical protein
MLDCMKMNVFQSAYYNVEELRELLEMYVCMRLATIYFTNYRLIS